jgi:hypothetical protein
MIAQDHAVTRRDRMTRNRLRHRTRADKPNRKILSH